MGAPDRQARMAAMIEQLPPPTRPVRKAPDITPLFELMTGQDVETGMVYTPEQLEEGGARARLLMLMDAYYPDAAPHYWRDFDLLHLDDFNEDDALPSEVVYAPVPLMAKINAGKVNPRPLRSHAAYEPRGLRQSTVLAVLIVVASLGLIVHKAGWI